MIAPTAKIQVMRQDIFELNHTKENENKTGTESSCLRGTGRASTPMPYVNTSSFTQKWFLGRIAGSDPNRC